tara:strand:- start:3719 stop:4396 length:678 start_codon:yes stop_codon:yes gene_type:complete
MNDWYEIWNNRSINKKPYDMLNLLKLNGHDTNTGSINKEDWLNYFKLIYKKSNINKLDSIYEIGCGAGAFLKIFYDLDHEVSGSDYSKNLLKVIKEIMPNAFFKNEHANKINTEKKYDIVLANSVFQYFPNYSYADKVLDNMLNKCKKKILILDINDYSKKNEMIFLKKEIQPGKINKKYIKHQFYDKNYFEKIALKYGLLIDIFPQNINNINSKYRYNVIMEIH